jgi:hypothetical protein
MEQPVAQAAAPAKARKGRRLSKLAVIALLAGALAPSLQVLRDSAGGRWVPADPSVSYLVLTAFDMLSQLLFVAAIALGLVALAQVAVRASELRGAALGLGGLVLGAAGMLSTVFADRTPVKLRDMVEAMGGGAGVYKPITTVIIVAAVILIEILLSMTGGGQPEVAVEQGPAEPGAS